MHGHLEWRWLALTIHFFNERQKSQQIIREDTILNTEFVEKLQLFIYDLIVISIAKFNKVSKNQARNEQIYKFFVLVICDRHSNKNTIYLWMR